MTESRSFGCRPNPATPSVFFEIAANPTSWRTIAHNFDFEREMYENVLVPRYGFPAIAREVEHCSQRLALANAYPAELDLLAQALGLPYRKDPELLAPEKRDATCNSTISANPAATATIIKRGPR